MFIIYIQVFLNYLSILLSCLIEGQSVIYAKSCLLASSIGKQCDWHDMFEVAEFCVVYDECKDELTVKERGKIISFARSRILVAIQQGSNDEPYFWSVWSLISDHTNIKQGRIVHRSGLNNENYKNINKKYKKSKIKDFIFNSTNGKSWYFLS